MSFNRHGPWFGAPNTAALVLQNIVPTTIANRRRILQLDTILISSRQIKADKLLMEVGIYLVKCECPTYQRRLLALAASILSVPRYKAIHLLSQNNVSMAFMSEPDNRTSAQSAWRNGVTASSRA